MQWIIVVLSFSWGSSLTNVLTQSSNLHFLLLLILTHLNWWNPCKRQSRTHTTIYSRAKVVIFIQRAMVMIIGRYVRNRSVSIEGQVCFMRPFLRLDLILFFSHLPGHPQPCELFLRKLFSFLGAPQHEPSFHRILLRFSIILVCLSISGIWDSLWAHRASSKATRLFLTK